MPQPWEKYAAQSTPSQGAEAGPWSKYSQPTQTAASAPSAPPSSMLQNIVTGASNFGKGVLKGAAGTLTSSDEWARKNMPAFMTNSNLGFGPPANLERERQMVQPHGTMQKLGKGAEQVGEFFVPGGAEEEAIGRLGALAPRLAPLIRAGVKGVGAEAVNRAQGGTPGVGAAGGAGGELVGAGMRAVAPKLAEAGLGITKNMRGYGRNIGRSILDETSSIRPAGIAEQAGNKISSDLMPQVESMVDAASVKPAPKIRGFLEPPKSEIPLAPSPRPRNPRMKPISFPAGVNPEEPLEYRQMGPNPGTLEDLPFSNPQYLSGTEHPELSGRVTPLQNPQQVTTRMGVLLRRPEMSASIPRTLESNPIASLSAPRGIVRSEMGRAVAENSPSLHTNLGKMADTLTGNFKTGEVYPENVTPRRLLDLQRGFNEEHLRWNPEVSNRAMGVGHQVYGAMGEELDRAVPEAQALRGRVANLIPIQQRAESLTREANMPQQVMRRFAAPTGALTGALSGGMLGYKEGGARGAGLGALGGVVAGPLIASPEGWIATSRLLNSAGGLRPIVGTALQANRKDKEEEK